MSQMMSRGALVAGHNGRVGKYDKNVFKYGSPTAPLQEPSRL